MTPREEERRAAVRLRSLAKARKAKARNAERRRRDEGRDRERFRAWLVRERLAFTLHTAEPQDRGLARAWVRVLAERPALYGRREAAA